MMLHLPFLETGVLLPGSGSETAFKNADPSGSEETTLKVTRKL
jgi:hypothetical protein